MRFAYLWLVSGSPLAIPKRICLLDFPRALRDAQAMSHLLHATAVAIDGHALLITGPSGSGKSDLALRLIDRGARLIADDAVTLEDGLLSGPARLRGQIEVRGVGILYVSTVSAPVPLTLHIDLVPRARVPRLPEFHVGPYGVQQLPLHAFDQSAPLKAEMALRATVPKTQAAQL